MIIKALNQRSLTLVAAGAVSIFLLALIWFRNAMPRRGRSSLNGEKSDDGLDQIYNETLGFEKVFVINLPARTDHRDSMILTAALSNISLNWVDGVKGDQVLEKVLPPGDSKKNLRPGDIGAWRAHINAIATIVEQKVATAIIMEDDADWDVRLKSQLQDFALASRSLIQPLYSDPSRYADTTFPTPNGKLDRAVNFYFDKLPRTITPHKSPYGDSWDVLWLGHCGMRLPSLDNPAWAPFSQKSAKGRVIHRDDKTVPEKEYLNLLSKDGDDIRKEYPPHTRVIHHPVRAQCSLVYAVTQASARRILYELSIKSFTNPYDIMLREYCEGSNGHRYHTCITVQPQLFNHHRAAGRSSSYSDINSDWGDEVVEKPSTENIRWSSRMNYEKLIEGETDFRDQFPDKNKT